MAGRCIVTVSITSGRVAMTEFNVPDMTCGHCADRITKAINEVDAGARVEVRIAEKTVLIESGLGAEQLAEAIQAAGYTPLPV